MIDYSEFFRNEYVLNIMQIGALIVSMFYIIFSSVLLKQVNKMTDTLEVGFEAPIRFIALVHLLGSIGVFLLALLIL